MIFSVGNKIFNSAELNTCNSRVVLTLVPAACLGYDK